MGEIMKAAVNLSLPPAVRTILEKLNVGGYEAYAVGGCVRDSLLGLTPKDWDICTSALPEQVKACFPDVPVADTGLKHGTVTLVWDGEPFEITTFRTDGEYKDHRHPQKVAFVRSLREDLARRDFTINAMAYHPKTGLADSFGGQEDLRQKRIRCVGEPDRRFKEDALRLLRAVRFAAVYGFSVEPVTADGIRQNRQLLESISAERILVEFTKLICGQYAEAVLREYAGLIQVFLPEIRPMMGFDQKTPYHCYDVWEHTLHAVGAAVPDKIVRLAVLFHDMGKPRCFLEDESGRGHFYGHAAVSEEIAAAVMTRLRFDNASRDRIRALVKEHDTPIGAQEKSVRRWLNRLGEEGLRQLIAVKEADTRAHAPAYVPERLEALKQVRRCLEEVLQKESCFQLRDLAVKGGDLLQLGFVPGKELGAALQALLDGVLDGRCPNDREALLKEAKRLMPQTKGS